jgi:YfiH family protein
MRPDYLAAAALPAAHGFFTRRGGVSTGPYASLNCSLSGGDVPEHVAQNRARAAGALGVAVERLVGVTQVHGTAVARVEAPWAAGAGPRADAMVTAVPGLALGIITADCAPVLLHDPAGIIGAAHAGWRGAAAGVLEATVAAMEALGARRARIAAVVGPCIAQASYEVGGDLRDEVLRGSQEARGFFAPGQRSGHFQFDRAGYCVARLAALGIEASALGADTLTDETRFFSHRRRVRAGGGPIGHQISIIVA